SHPPPNPDRNCSLSLSGRSCAFVPASDFESSACVGAQVRTGVELDSRNPRQLPVLVSGEAGAAPGDDQCVGKAHARSALQPVLLEEPPASTSHYSPPTGTSS